MSPDVTVIHPHTRVVGGRTVHVKQYLQHRRHRSIGDFLNSNRPRWQGAASRPFHEHVFMADYLWESVGGNEFDRSEQPRLHPERYIDRRVHNPKGYPGPLLRRGQVETRFSGVGGKPMLYDVTPLREGESWSTYPPEQLEPNSMGQGEGGMTPLRIVPGSQRPLSAVFRIMDEREYEQALQRGYIQSDARMNLARWEGTVASTRSTGMFYAPWGSSTGPQDAHARIVRIRVMPEDGWWVDTDSYVKTPRRIPIDRIEAVTPAFTKAEAETELRAGTPAAVEAARSRMAEVVNRKG